MRLTLKSILALVFISFSCSDIDQEKPVKVEDIVGTWKLSIQKVNEINLDPFSQIYIAKNSTTVLWRDTIHFENTRFEFQPYDGNVLNVNGFNLLFQDGKKIKGFWRFDEESKQVGFFGAVIEPSDTIINGYQYYKWSFIDYLYFKKTRMPNKDKLILFSDKESLILERLK